MLGLALEGGGARGSYQIGAMQAFLEEGLRFDAITGTSIGAINGAMFAQGDYAKARQLWLKLSSSNLFTTEEQHFLALVSRGKFSLEAFSYFSERALETLSGGGVDTSRIRALIERHVDVPKLLASPVDFGLVTVSVPDFKPHYLFKEQMGRDHVHDYILASASFPGFQQVTIDKKRYIDGGAYDNCPVNMLLERGCDTVYAVRTLGLGIYRPARDKSRSVTVIVPSDKLGPIMDFDPRTAQANMQMGYYDTMRALRRCAGKRYYLTAGIAPVPAFQRLALIGEQDIALAAKALKLPMRLPPRRMLFERIFPALITELDLPRSAHYGDLLLAMLENRAERADLPRFSFYGPEDFLRRVRAAQPEAQPSGADRACDILIESL